MLSTLALPQSENRLFGSAVASVDLDNGTVLPSQQSAALSHSPIDNPTVVLESASSEVESEPSKADSPDAEIISAYESQIQELQVVYEKLRGDVELNKQELANLTEQTLHLNEEILRRELDIFQADGSGDVFVEEKKIYNFTNVPRIGGSSTNEIRDNRVQSTQDSEGTSTLTRPNEQQILGTTEEQPDDFNAPLGRSDELEVEVSYEDASPSDQQAYNKHISEIGGFISYSEFRDSEYYRPDNP